MVEKDLREDRDIHHHLKAATQPELQRCLSHEEVARLECVAAQPEKNHLYAVCVCVCACVCVCVCTCASMCISICYYIHCNEV